MSFRQRIIVLNLFGLLLLGMIPGWAGVTTSGPGTLNASALTGTVAVANGGTGSANAAGARTNLGLAIGTDVQAQNATLAAVAGGTYTGDDSITTVGTITTGVWTGTDVAVPDGGTGAGTFTDGGVLIGNGTSAVQVTTAGTSGQVLTSNGAGVDPTFQDATGGSVALIGSQTADGTSSVLTVGSIPNTYKMLKIAIVGRSDAAASNNVTVLGTFNADTGANYYRHYAGGANGAADVGQQTAQNGMGFNIPGATSTANYATNVEITVVNYATTTFFKYAQATSSDANSEVLQIHDNSYRWNSTAAVTSYTATCTGNWVTGSVLYVWGHK